MKYTKYILVLLLAQGNISFAQTDTTKTSIGLDEYIFSVNKVAESKKSVAQQVLILDNNTRDEALWKPLEKRCAELGLLSLDGTLGDEARKDVAAALAAIVRGCDLKREDACRLAATAYAGQWGVPKDAAKAKAFFERGCGGAAATEKACVQLAERLKKK